MTLRTPVRLAVCALMACSPSAPETPLAKDTEVTNPGIPVGPTDSGVPTPAGNAVLTVELEDPFDTYPVGESTPTLDGRVSISQGTLAAVTLELISDIDGVVTPPELQADGSFQWSPAELSAGLHELTLTASHASAVRDAEDTVTLGICQWPAFEDFSTDPTLTNGDWTVYGDAYWDPQGWLEVTGNTTSREGQIYKTSAKVNPGDFRLEFKIATGGGGSASNGADGFSVNVIDVPDVAELNQYIARSAHGGCLGYGIVSGCDSSGYTVNGFHVEIDTWYNNQPWINDPTTQNHIAINLDGDPGSHVLWAATPNIEDNVWRQMVVQAVGERLTVDMDGQRIIDSAIPGFTSDGGYIGLSGSTGAFHNFHRFDDLQIYDRCLVPQ
jgi:hypothetical protein